MTTQPNQDPSWIWAVQSEMDGLKRGTDQRLNDMSARLNSVVSPPEYNADKRTTDLQLSNLKDKIDDAAADLAVVKSDLVKSVDDLKTANATEHARLETMIQAETTARQNQNKDDAQSRQSQFRWMISAVLIPIVLAVMDLMLNKK